jgi:ABC-type branched-subunit amino acid transport system substrate-binding protein
LADPAVSVTPLGVELSVLASRFGPAGGSTQAPGLVARGKRFLLLAQCVRLGVECLEARLAGSRVHGAVDSRGRLANFARVAAREDLLGVAHAMLAKRLGLKRVYLLDPGGTDWKVVHADPFRRAARRVGVGIAGSHAFDPEGKSYDALARRVARSGAQGVLLTGGVGEGGDRVVKALRARLGTRLKIMVTDLFAPIPELLELAGPAARGLYMSTSDVPPAALDLSPAGRRFARDFGATAPQGTFSFVLQAAQATDVVLGAIARSDGSRASVLSEMRTAQVKDGILGSFRFDRNGDITPAPVMILRVTGRTPRDESLPTLYQGATVDRVVRVPGSLAR